MLTTLLKSVPIPAFWWCCTGYWIGHLIAQDGTLLKGKKLTKTINTSSLFFTVWVTWFLCRTWEIPLNRDCLIEVWCTIFHSWSWSYRDLSDGGLPGEQKCHKLQLKTKSNVVIYQKNLFDRNSVCKTVIKICGDLSMSLIIFQSLIMGERYLTELSSTLGVTMEIISKSRIKQHNPDLRSLPQ